MLHLSMALPVEYYLSLPMPTSVRAFGEGYRVDVIHWPGCYSVGESQEKAEAALRPSMAIYVRALLAKKITPLLPPFYEYPELHVASLAFQAGLDLGRRQGVAHTLKKNGLKTEKVGAPESFDNDESGTAG